VNISQVGLNLIKSFEGCRLTAYKVTSSEKYYTIGYGHYGSDVRAGQTISQQQADSLLIQDVQRFVNGVNQCVHVPVTQYQFDSLVSLCYNIGFGAFQQSSLVQKLNNGDYQGTANEFDLWIHSGGKVLQGLVTRRKAEKALFLKAESTQPVSTSGIVGMVRVLCETDIRQDATHSSGFIRNAHQGELYNVIGHVDPDWHHVITASNEYGWIDGNQGQNLELVNPSQGQSDTQDYTIRSGESLGVIAKRLTTSIDNLLNLNPQIHNKNLVYAGQVIKVPKR
jgi:GH24 family phage-related lysozyme (muramidase)/LysM repeat protein